jgi:hypothetical protein
VNGGAVRRRATAGMSWDVFDHEASPAEAARPVSLLPRGIVHPHFTCCSGVWPDHEADALEQIERAEASLRECSPAACIATLRTSSGIYARDAASALSRAHSALASSDVVRAATLGRSLADLCAAQLEEADWDNPCWQEANLLGLAYQLVHVISCQLCAPPRARDMPPDAARGDAQGSIPPAEGVAECGRLAIALFNMAVVSGASGSPISKWQPWLGLLLSASELLVAQADPHQCRSPVSTDAGGAPLTLRLPSSLPRGPLAPQLGRRPAIPSADDKDITCARFFREHLQPAHPVLVRGHLHAQGWAALDYFASLDRLRCEHGHRLVPVNLGSPLVGYRGVVHMPLRRLIDDHLAPSIHTQAAAEQAAAAAALQRGEGADGPFPDEESLCAVAYMSQHHLLHQAPALQALIAVPPLLLGRSLSPVNMWLGTRGTVTSLHSDPDDNLLCQASGTPRPDRPPPCRLLSCDCGAVASIRIALHHKQSALARMVHSADPYPAGPSPTLEHPSGCTRSRLPSKSRRIPPFLRYPPLLSTCLAPAPSPFIPTPPLFFSRKCPTCLRRSIPPTRTPQGCSTPLSLSSHPPIPPTHFFPLRSLHSPPLFTLYLLYPDLLIST